MNIDKIRSLAIFILGLILALYIGDTIASDRKEAFGTIIILSGIIITIAFGKNAWMLMLSFCLPGTFFVGGFTVPPCMILVPMAFIVQLTRKTIGTEKFYWRFHPIDVTLGLFVGILALSFVRDPVWVQALGGSEKAIGGKIYVSGSIALIVYITYSLQRISLDQILSIMYKIFIFTMMVTALNFLGLIGLNPLALISSFYSLGSNADPENLTGTSALLTGLGFIGSFGATYVLTKHDPISYFNLTKPWRLICLIGGFIAAALTGQRTNLFQYLLNALFSFIIWKRIIIAILVCILPFTIWANLYISQMPLTFLNPSIQRALDPFKLNIDEKIHTQAQHSSKFRYEMWDEILYNDKYLLNPWIGDGFKRDWDKLLQLQSQFERTAETKQFFMYARKFHSGPISDIKGIGYIGFLFHILLGLTVTIYGIKYTRYFYIHYPEKGWLFPFFFLSSISQIFFFVIAFGDPDRDMHLYIISAAVIKLIGNALALEKEKEKKLIEEGKLLLKKNNTTREEELIPILTTSLPTLNK